MKPMSVLRMRQAAAPAIPANVLIYPLTYDEEDAAGANALTRLGAAPHVTPQGFEGDGNTSRYKLSSLPAWVASASAKVSMHALVTLHCQTRNATRDVIASLCVDDATANPKLELCATTQSTDMAPVLSLRAYNGAVSTVPLGKNTWNYGLRYPVLTGGCAPQTHFFIDSDTILLIAAFSAGADSRCYKVRISDQAVLGSFTFGSGVYTHIAACALRDNGEMWFVDYDSGMAIEVDLDASFLAGTAVINQTWDLTNLGTTVLTGVEFITVSGTEYILVALYGSVTADKYLYMIPTSKIVNGGTFALVDRYKRFVLSNNVQGISIRPSDGLLYAASTPSAGIVTSYDLTGQMGSLADGGTLVSTTTHIAPSDCCEDIKWHPTTGEAWVGTEGSAVPGDSNGFRGYWRSPLTDNLPVERLVVVDYDGAGTFSIFLDGVLFNSLSLTPTATPGVLSIGAPPQAAAGWTNGFALATVRSLAIKNEPFTAGELAALAAGAYEANSLTVYTASLTNPGAESGTTGWTNETGGIGTRSAAPNPRYEEGVSNTAYFTGGASANTLSRQRVALTTITGLSTGAIDTLTAAGSLWARATWYQSNFNGLDDASAMGIRWLDGTPTQLSVTYGAVTASGFNQVWRRRTLGVLADSGARNIDALHRMDRSAGTNNDGYHDDVVLKVYVK